MPPLFTLVRIMVDHLGYPLRVTLIMIDPNYVTLIKIEAVLGRFLDTDILFEQLNWQNLKIDFEVWFRQLTLEDERILTGHIVKN